MSRGARRVRLGGGPCALVALTLVLSAGCAPASPGGGDPPAAEAEATAPGSVLEVVPWSGEAPRGAVVQSVRFRTLDAEDRTLSSHALVISPSVAFNSRILLWEHGSTGVQSACSPSGIPGWLTGGAVPALDELLAEGWTVVAPDFADPREDRPMPYLVGAGEARASLDAVRAARQLSAGALASGFAVWGHSQGGHAALWVASVAPSYAPELAVRAVAAFAPAVDPGALITSIASPAQAALLGSWVAAGYDAWYGDDAATTSYDEALAPILDEIAEHCLADPTTPELAAGLERVASGRTPVDIGDSSSVFARRLEENAAPATPGTATLVVRGGADEVVPPESLQRWLDDVSGADGVEARSYPGVGHSAIVQAGSAAVDDALTWTNQRME